MNICIYVYISREQIYLYIYIYIRHRACATACHELGFNDLYIYICIHIFWGNDDLNNDMHTHILGGMMT